MRGTDFGSQDELFLEELAAVTGAFSSVGDGDGDGVAVVFVLLLPLLSTLKYVRVVVDRAWLSCAAEQRDEYDDRRRGITEKKKSERPRSGGDRK